MLNLHLPTLQATVRAIEPPPITILNRCNQNQVLFGPPKSLTKATKLQTLNFLVWKVPSHSPTPLKMAKPVKEKQIVHNTNTQT